MTKKRKQQIAWISDNNNSDSSGGNGHEHRKVLAILDGGGESDDGTNKRERDNGGFDSVDESDKDYWAKYHVAMAECEERQLQQLAPLTPTSQTRTNRRKKAGMQFRGTNNEAKQVEGDSVTAATFCFDQKLANT